MGRVQVFDVNETLLDLAGLDPHFERIFGDSGVRVAWFTQMLQSALVATVTGAYHPFGDHAMAALEMTADQAGVPLADDDKQAEELSEYQKEVSVNRLNNQRRPDNGIGRVRETPRRRTPHNPARRDER